MSYNAIFEIGPIHETLEASRKLRDYAGGSFLFSYLMGIMAKEIIDLERTKSKAVTYDKVNGIIKEPFLENDPLFKKLTGTSTYVAKTGTIPDRLYCALENNKAVTDIKQIFTQQIRELFRQCLDDDEVSPELNSLAEYQLFNYFRFFYVWADDGEPDDGHKLDPGAGTRGGIYEFEHSHDGMNTTKSKDEKCSLCGDRKKVITLEKAMRGGKDEHLCAVCLIKRRFVYKMKDIIGGTEYPSTTDIAAKIVKEVLEKLSQDLEEKIIEFGSEHFDDKGDPKDEVLDELEKYEINNLKKAIEQKNTKKIIKNLSYQFYFSDGKPATVFKTSILEIINSKENPVVLHQLLSDFNINEKIQIKPWLKQAFYCIIYLDGDSTGKFFSGLKEKDKKIKVSEAISEYSRESLGLVKENQGILVFSGGEDTIAVVHPLFLISTVKALSAKFQELIKKQVGTAPTLSAGALICNHKHPLTLAIRDANSMLFDRAKSMDGKDSLAVKIIKGSGEACYFHAKINESVEFNLSDFENLIGIGIPRGFVYKLIEDKEVLQATLKTKEEMWGYVKFLYEKSRGGVTDEALAALKILVNKTLNKNNEPDLDQIINRLYFARFLEGESL